MKERIASQVTSMHNVLMLAGLLGVGLTGSIALQPQVAGTLAHHGVPTVASVAQQVGNAAAHAMHAAPAAQAAKVVQDALAFSDPAYDQLRQKLRWLPVRLGTNVLQTPDSNSRLLLVQAAAEKAGLQDVGLSYRDVYGIINAETSWIPRLGASKDGTPNLGIAQFEPATARAVGLRNPGDPVEAVHAAAMHLKDAARWSAKRIAGLKLSDEERALKLREGVSIYYNLSTKGRNVWNGKNTAKLPVETRRHIANARVGAREAAELEAQLEQLRGRMEGARTMTAALR